MHLTGPVFLVVSAFKHDWLLRGPVFVRSAEVIGLARFLLYGIVIHPLTRSSS